MESNATGNYQSYQAMVTQVNQGIVDLEGVCTDLKMEDHAKSLDENHERMLAHVFRVGIMGEFRRGKSTVINALLGANIVPSDIVPCSATLNRIRWGTKPEAEVHFKDGTTKNVSVEELSNYVTKITTESERMAQSVEDSVVYYPCSFCQNGVEILDTPGLNDDERMSDIAEKVIPTLDAIIMVLTVDSPFSQSEATFVRDKVLTSDLGRIIFVINKIDTVDEEDRPRLVENIRSRIQESVLGRYEGMYGKDSPEYHEAQGKMAGIRLFPISARQGLKGKIKNDNKLLEESGINEFEAALSKLLTVERGVLELITPVNTVLSIASEAKGIVTMRRDAMNIEAESFEEIQKDAKEKILASRDGKRKEIDGVRERAGVLYAELLPQTEQAYDTIQENLMTYISEFPIDNTTLTNDNAVNETAAKVSKNIDEEISRQISMALDKMSIEIQKGVGKEIANLETFVKSIETDINSIGQNIAAHSKSSGQLRNFAIDLGISMFLPYGIPGVGGIIAGYKSNGWAGAAVGGGVGAVAGFAAALAIACVSSTLLVPALVVGSAVSVFAGKGAVNAIFKKKLQARRENEVRKELEMEILHSMNELRKKRVLENWLKDATNETYKIVTDTLNKEVEASLQSMENTLTQIQLDLQRKEVERDNILADMDKLQDKLNSVSETLHPVKDKLEETLKAIDPA